MTLRTFSYGGGVQSTAALVLAARGEIEFRIFLFANVGDDSEAPWTIEYVRDVAMPYAAAHGIELHELHRTRRDGTVETLLERVERTTHSITIPARMANGAPGRRNCTTKFKIDVIGQWLRRHGATAAEPAVVGLGISLDEFHRARTSSGIDYELLEYPLIERRLTRQDCINIIRDEGLPVPQKSSCWFCPFHTLNEWRRLKREQPELFEKSVELERLLIERRAKWGKDAVWLTSKARPLDEVIAGEQLSFEDDLFDNCESGYCMI